MSKVDIFDGSDRGSDGYNTPFDVVPLPSEGRLYDSDHPLHQETDVQIKAMTTVEENILTSRALIRKGQVVNELIRSCLVNKSIDPSNLLIGDKSAILLAIRISGFGTEYLMKTSCPACEMSFDHAFNLGECKIKKLGADPVKPGQNLFEFTLPHSKRKVLFSLLTAGDQQEVTEMQEARRKALKKATGRVSEVDTHVSDRLMKSIVEIGGEKEKGKIVEIIKNMLALDSRPLREFVDDIEPDVEMLEEVKCPHCGVSDEHEIPMGVEFLWPKRRTSVRR